MAHLIWTEPALQDLDAVADYIALENPNAAKSYVKKVFEQVASLKTFPKMGRVPPEFEDLPQYRQLLVAPCRIFYKVVASDVFVLHVMRCERLLRRWKLMEQDENQ